MICVVRVPELPVSVMGIPTGADGRLGSRNGNEQRSAIRCRPTRRAGGGT